MDWSWWICAYTGSTVLISIRFVTLVYDGCFYFSLGWEIRWVDILPTIMGKGMAWDQHYTGRL